MAISPDDVPQAVKELAELLPRSPDGRIDYRQAQRAAVLTCFVKYRDKLLLLRRSDKVGTYRGQWNTVAGYLDELKPLANKVREELLEELGFTLADDARIVVGTPYEFRDDAINRTWVVHPVLVTLHQQLSPRLKLNWEHTEYAWVSPEQLADFDTVPQLDESLTRVLPARAERSGRRG
jgi:isopentenyldiphosphate isomerase